jgi:hypothetical protein
VSCGSAHTHLYHAVHLLRWCCHGHLDEAHNLVHHLLLLLLLVML